MAEVNDKDGGIKKTAILIIEGAGLKTGHRHNGIIGNSCRMLGGRN